MSNMAAVKENTSDDKMTKHILEQYSDALARIKLLRLSAKNLEFKISEMNEKGYYVTDVVTKGKKGKKPLGTVILKGFPEDEYNKVRRVLEKRKSKLMYEEQKLLDLTVKIEEYISELEDIEMRNILTLYYVENLTWVQVAHEMNASYENGNYSEGSCRLKHDRFLEKK